MCCQVAQREEDIVLLKGQMSHVQQLEAEVASLTSKLRLQMAADTPKKASVVAEGKACM